MAEETTTTEQPLIDPAAQSNSDGQGAAPADEGSESSLVNPQAGDEATPPADDATPPAEGEQPSDEGAPADEGEGDDVAAPPASPEDYTAEAPEGMPEGIDLDPAFIEDARRLAHENGLTQDQFDGMLKAMPGVFERAIEAQKNQSRQWAEQSRELDLLKEGEGFDANMEIVNRAARDFGGEEFTALLEAIPGLGNNPAVVSMLYRIGKATQEDGTIVGGDKSQAKPKLNPSDSASLAGGLYGADGPKT